MAALLKKYGYKDAPKFDKTMETYDFTDKWWKRVPAVEFLSSSSGTDEFQQWNSRIPAVELNITTCSIQPYDL